MPEPFRADTDDDGVADEIKWGRLVSTAVGIVLGTLGIRLADLVGALISLPIELYQSVVDLIDGLIGAIVGLPTRMIDASVDEAVAFVSELGIAGFVVAIALVVVTAWLVANAREVAG